MDFLGNHWSDISSGKSHVEFQFKMDEHSSNMWSMLWEICVPGACEWSNIRTEWGRDRTILSKWADIRSASQPIGAMWINHWMEWHEGATRRFVGPPQKWWTGVASNRKLVSVVCCSLIWWNVWTFCFAYSSSSSFSVARRSGLFRTAWISTIQGRVKLPIVYCMRRMTMDNGVINILPRERARCALWWIADKGVICMRRILHKLEWFRNC